MTLTQIKPAGLSKPVDLADNEKIRLGTSNDLEIYHSGTQSFILNNTGHLILSNMDPDADNNIILRARQNEPSIVCNNDGAVELYHNGTKKFETRSNGIEVLGHVLLGDNYRLGLGNVGSNGDLQIYHDGTNSNIKNSTNQLNILGNDIRLLNNGASKALIKAFDSGAAELYYDGSKKFETTSAGVSVTGNIYGSQDLILSAGGAERLNMTHSGGGNFVIKNPTAASLSFGTNNQNSELVIANGGNVGIGTTGPNEKLEVAGNCRLSSGGATRTLHMGPASAGIEYNVNGTTFIQGRTDAYPLAFKTNSLERMRITSTGEVGIGTTAPNADVDIATTVEDSTGTLAQHGVRLFHVGATDEEVIPITGGFVTQVDRARAGIGFISKQASSTDGYAGAIGFYTRAAADGTGLLRTDERMRITQSGKVGIGTSSPEAKLHISGTEASLNSRIRITDTTNNHTFAVGADGSGSFQSTINDTRHIIYTNGTMRGSWTADGICFGTDTAAANALDDYEEGTFTPTYGWSSTSQSGFSFSQNYGRYTKIGRIVHIQIWTNFTATPTGGNAVQVQLPFPSANDGGYRGGISFSWNEITYVGQSSTAQGGRTHINQNTSWMELGFRSDVNGGGWSSSAITPSGMSNGAHWQAEGVYMTNS